MIRPLAGLVVLAAALAHPATSWAQAPVPPAADSVMVLRGAREAQAAFEQFRYQQFPFAVGGGRSGPCEVRVGRFCYWFDDRDDWRPPAEHRRVAERRAQLLTVLQRAATTLPGDGWIAGQRVRYLDEAGLPDSAAAAAHACRADAWWCAALAGYAYHRGGRFADAHAAFTRAVGAMPGDVRREWTDPATVLDDDDARTLSRADTSARVEMAARVWWLADPLWSEPGNDRWTEHLARWVFDRLQEDARPVERTAWGRDSRELLLRYGRHVWWERMPPGYTGRSLFASDGLVAYGAPKSWEFLPPLDAAGEIARLDEAAYPLEGPTASRYAPAYVRRWIALPFQVARFRRGPDVELVARYAWADSLSPAFRLRAYLIAMADPESTPWTLRGDGRGTLRLPVPAGPTVVSLEVRDDSAALVGRARIGLDATLGGRVSDLLLLADAQARPTTLDAAAPLARGTTVVRAGEPLAVFWEMYDRPEDDSVTISVRLIPGQAGWTRRQLQAVGLARADRAVRMRWTEGTPGGEIVGRSLGVMLPADLRPGAYTLEVTVESADADAAVARRALTVVRPQRAAAASPGDDALPADPQ